MKNVVIKLNQLLIISFFIVFLSNGIAQSTTTSKKKVSSKMGTQEYIYSDKMHLPKVATMSEEVVQISLGFMGTPAPHLITDAEFARLDPREIQLQPISREYLAISLDMMDCVGFVESVIAVSQAHHSRMPSYALFKQNIKNLRYRNGIVDYASRLHYFSDWIYENQKRGILKDVTQELDGEPYDKVINYMSLKRDTFYGNMADPNTYSRIRNKEIEITERQKWYIPKANVINMESKLKNGDIIAITNGREGMDIAHCGFVYFQEDRPYLMHASTKLGYVTITKEPLHDYLAMHTLQTGIMVARLMD